MLGGYLHVWLFLFAVIVGTEVKETITLHRGLYSRVEFIDEKLDQHVDSLISVEWTKINGSLQCLCFMKNNNNTTSYSRCCGQAHLNNNSLILENVTAQDDGVYIKKIIIANGTSRSQNFTLTIEYPPNVTEIVVSQTSNTSVTLLCEVNESFQHLIWKREGVVILEKHRHSFSERNQTLHINNITRSDSGNYSCTASNQYGQTERHTYLNFTGDNLTVSLNQGNGNSAITQPDQTVLLCGLTLLGVLGLCVVCFCLYKRHHGKRAENPRTTDEGDADNDIGVYQEVTFKEAEAVMPLPYVYTDYIKPKVPGQASAAQQFDDFGYSEVTAIRQ